MGARERERERRRQRLDRREVLGVDSHLAQADAGQRRRHQRSARYVAELAVLVDHRAQRRRVLGGGVAEGEAHLGVGSDLHPHRERRDRIEAGVERRAVAALGHRRRLFEGGERMARVAVAAEPALAVDLDPDRDVRRLGLGEEVGGDEALVGRQAGLAREDDRLVVRLPFGAHEEIRERRMRFVGARVGESDLERRQQLEVEHALAAVVQDDAAELDVVLRADPDCRRRFQLGPGRAEGDPVGVQAAVVVRGRIGRRMLRQRDRARLSVPADVEEPAVRIAQRVVARARDRDVAAPARARAVGAQGDGVAPVREQVGRLDRGHSRRHLAEHSRRALQLQAGDEARRRLAQRRHLARRALVQERCDRLDARVAHAPVARHAVEEDVGDGDDAHPLVVRHERADAGDAFRARLATGRVVERFDEAVAAARACVLEAAQVGGGAMRRDLRREGGRVRRDDELVVRRAPQRQARHALRRVLVGERVVAAGVRRLRDSPRHVVLAREGDVLEHGRLRGAVQDAAVRLVEDERRHQVLEHRPRPRAQAGELADGVERPAERDPVRGRHVALGDRPQARRARFRGEQVVEAAVELVLGGAKADVEETALAVEEEGEVGLGGERAAGRRDTKEPRRRARVGDAAGRVAQRRAQGRQVVLDRPGEPVGGARRRLVDARRRARRELGHSGAEQRVEARRVGADPPERRGAGEHVGEGLAAERLVARRAQQGDPQRRRGEGALQRCGRERLAAEREARLGEGKQVGAEVAAVDRRDVERRQRFGRLRVVPVEEVAAMARQRRQGRERRFDALDRLDRADPAEALRAGGGEEVETDVGRRGAVRDHVARHDLQVVGRQMVVVGADDALEQPPGVAADVVEQGAIVGRERVAALARPRPAHPPGPQRRHRPDQAEQRRRRRMRRARRHQRQPQHGRGDGRAPVLADEDRELGRRRGLGRRRRRPFEQVASADELAVERTHDRVGRHQCQLEQLGEQPGGAGECAAEVGERLAIEVEPGDVVAARRQAGERAHQRAAGKGEGDEQERRPGRNTAGREGEREQGERERRDQRAAQVVEHLPAVDRAQAPAPGVPEERQQLPVAARPAVHARRGDVGVERRVLDHGDVGDRGAARHRSFEEVVAEDAVLGQAAAEDGVHRLDVEQALAGVSAFAEDVLVDLGARGAVRVDAGLPGEEPVVQRDLLGLGQRRRDVRLQDRVATLDALAVG